VQPTAPIEYVSVVIYRPWETVDGLGEHEVWAGDDFADKRER
jgi:hypothetical protein